MIYMADKPHRLVGTRLAESVGLTEGMLVRHLTGDSAYEVRALMGHMEIPGDRRRMFGTPFWHVVLTDAEAMVARKHDAQEVTAGFMLKLAAGRHAPALQ